MVLNFGQLVEQVAIDLKYGPEPGDDVKIRLRRYINEGLRELLRAANMADQREATLTLTSVANQQTYGLPTAFDRIQRIHEPLGSRRLVMRTTDWVLDTDPQSSTLGDPYVWIPLGMQAIATPIPLDGRPIYAESTSASDDQSTGMYVRITGIRKAGGPPLLMQTVLQGTSRVPLVVVNGSTTFAPNDIIAITQFTISSPAQGDIVLYADSFGSFELARIPKFAGTSSLYYGIRLWPTPQGPLDYLVTGTVRQPDLVYDTDVPRISPQYVDALKIFARRKEYQTNTADNDRFMVEDVEWKKVLADLRAFSQFPPDYRPVAGGAEERGRWSNLGGHYPPDGWGW